MALINIENLHVSVQSKDILKGVSLSIGAGDLQKYVLTPMFIGLCVLLLVEGIRVGPSAAEIVDRIGHAGVALPRAGILRRSSTVSNTWISSVDMSFNR